MVFLHLPVIFWLNREFFKEIVSAKYADGHPGYEILGKVGDTYYPRQRDHEGIHKRQEAVFRIL